jgi:hypothetical protein
MPNFSVALAFAESILIGRDLKGIRAIGCVKENVSICTMSLSG